MAAIPITEGWDGIDTIFRVWRWVRLLGFIYLSILAGALTLLVRAFLQPLPEVTVPNVVQLDREQAVSQLEQLGFKVHADTYDMADHTVPNTIIYQSLPDGQHVRAGRPIFLITCGGPAHVIVPDVRGQQRDDALAALVTAGLKPTVSSTAHSPKVPYDAVIDQIPAPGQQVDAQSAAALVVSDGPPEDSTDLAPGASLPSSTLASEEKIPGVDDGSGKSSRPGSEKDALSDDKLPPIPPPDLGSDFKQADSPPPDLNLPGDAPLPKDLAKPGDLPPMPPIDVPPDPGEQPKVPPTQSKPKSGHNREAQRSTIYHAAAPYAHLIAHRIRRPDLTPPSLFTPEPALTYSPGDGKSSEAGDSRDDLAPTNR